MGQRWSKGRNRVAMVLGLLLLLVSCAPSPPAVPPSTPGPAARPTASPHTPADEPEGTASAAPPSSATRVAALPSPAPLPFDRASLDAPLPPPFPAGHTGLREVERIQVG